LAYPVTLGNHTATQSTFSSPCIPAHDTDTTINGFNSGFRDAGNGQAITNLAVIVENPNVTIWFFDYNTCAQGGGGAININDSSLETLDGFQVNINFLSVVESSPYR
jgi:predicted outer membrane repeat protein